MKKIILLSLLILSFFSCSSDDELTGRVTYKIVKPESVVSRPENITVEFTDFFDVSVTYKDASGKMITENQVTLPWEKSFTVVAPYTANAKMSVSLKAGVTLTNEVCNPTGSDLLRLYVESEGTKMSPNKIGYEITGSGTLLSKPENIEYLINRLQSNYSFDFNRENLDWWKKGSGAN
ncbi:hypothetical protein [Dysgonomonas sp. 511]|uniref:hypothetical protein n=1 Tax=Dysgonomonas sp. 511 TaxID=2302930 RepID=UPI0013D66696|nr:hypothetical protein [Dysgonomonas sp. 511]